MAGILDESTWHGRVFTGQWVEPRGGVLDDVEPPPVRSAPLSVTRTPKTWRWRAPRQPRLRWTGLPARSTSDRPADALLLLPDARIAWAATADRPRETAVPALRQALTRWFGAPTV
jgi:hypothetical protein